MALTNTDKTRLIRVKEKTYFSIKKMGMMGETFDDVMQRVLGLHEKKMLSKKSKKDKEIASKV